MKKAVFLIIGVGLLTAGLSLFLQTSGFTVQAFLPGGQTPATTTEAFAPAPAGNGSSYTVPGAPARLRIPAIGVDATVQSVGLSWKGTGDMGIPTNFTDVAWYNGGPAPGAPGSAVINGHLDGKEVPQAVFYNLGKLKPGDLVEVEDKKGMLLQFRVVETKLYDYDAPTAEIFAGDASKTRLNLITCTGDWLTTEKLYSKRIVVFTELVQ